MTNAIGWQAATDDILSAGLATRHAVPFDERARARQVEERLAEARRFPLWPLAISLAGFAFPHGWLWATLGLGIWVAGIIQAQRRAKRLSVELAAETAQLEQDAAREAARVRSLVAGADAGDRACLQALLTRWHERRPEAVHPITFDLVASGLPNGRVEWLLAGRALRRDQIGEGTLRVGRGGRTVIDKRKASEIDDDLAQLNAAAVLSVLRALFSGGTRHAVSIRLLLTPTPSEGPILWSSLATDITEENLLTALARHTSPVDAVRALGGDVGRCRAQRYTAARAATGPSVPAAPPNSSTPALRDARSMADHAAGPTVPVIPEGSTAGRPTPAPGSLSAMLIRNGASTGMQQDPYGARSAAVAFGDAQAPPKGAAIPRPPAGHPVPTGGANAVPTPAAVRRDRFAAIARTYASYPGDPSARFVAFQQYFATYIDMAPGQLKFYFKWRNAVRNGEAPRTDLSYVFVHVYELLHVIGAEGAADAARQLERLWAAYRTTYPQLDNYLVPWTADLLATELGQPEALAWIERAVAAGASPRGPDALLVLDKYWGAGDYRAMPRAGVAILAGDPRLGDNKFYQQHNAGPEGDGWVDRAYREALAVTDRAVATAEGRSPRELAIARDGLTTISREAFSGAVYDFRRRTAVLGKVPALPDSSATIATYRNAVRYAENLLRREKGFAAKLRGVEVSPGLAKELDAHFVAYLKATKPKPRVTIDLGRAQELARESAVVRARLLAGLDQADAPAGAAPPALTSVPASVGETVAPASVHAAPTMPSAHAAPTMPSAPSSIPAGLLTDLAAIDNAVRGLSAPARAVLEALAGCGWEAPETHPALLAAAHGALVGPLVDEINERAVDAVGDILLVHEAVLLVVQEDFRDEVYWVLRGTLDGFGTVAAASVPSGVAAASASAGAAPAMSGRAAGAAARLASTDGFGPAEVRALAALAGEVRAGGGAATLDAIAEAHGTTPLLLLDHVNELALASPYGDLLIEVDAVPPRIHDDAAAYVAELLARVAPMFAPPADTDPLDDEADADATDPPGADSLVLRPRRE